MSRRYLRTANTGNRLRTIPHRWTFSTSPNCYMLPKRRDTASAVSFFLRNELNGKPCFETPPHPAVSCKKFFAYSGYFAARDADFPTFPVTLPSEDRRYVQIRKKVMKIALVLLLATSSALASDLRNINGGVVDLAPIY